MKLINAEKLKQHYAWWDDDRQKLFDEIVDQQKAVEAVPVIRCKDCKHYDGYYCHEKWWGNGYGNYTPPVKDEDGFCDWAERKDDETD